MLVLFVIWIDWGTMGLMRLLILVVGGCRGGLLTLGGIFLVFAPGGVLLSLRRFFIAISRAAVNHDGGTGASIVPLVWQSDAVYASLGGKSQLP